MVSRQNSMIHKQLINVFKPFAYEFLTMVPTGILGVSGKSSQDVAEDSHATKNSELQDAGEGLEQAGESICTHFDDNNGHIFGVNKCSDSIDSSIFSVDKLTKKA
jgi:hypothetical protein